jgi:hypothetical protein
MVNEDCVSGGRGNFILQLFLVLEHQQPGLLVHEQQMFVLVFELHGVTKTHSRASRWSDQSIRIGAWWKSERREPETVEYWNSPNATQISGTCPFRLQVRSGTQLGPASAGFSNPGRARTTGFQRGRAYEIFFFLDESVPSNFRHVHLELYSFVREAVEPDRTCFPWLLCFFIVYVASQGSSFYRPTEHISPCFPSLWRNVPPSVEPERTCLLFQMELVKGSRQPLLSVDASI